MRVSDDNLRGKTIIAADGQAVGEVVALLLDTETWSITSLQTKVRREMANKLGASRSIFHASTVEIPVNLVQSIGDAVVLSVATDQLRQLLPAEGESARAR